MMKKLTILFMALCVTFTSCAQKTKDQQKENTMMIHVPEKRKDITADNFVERMLKEVQHFDKEPRYFIRPVQNNCVYEILVNDVRAYKDYGLDVLATPVSINHTILKSGKQTMTVRMYPIGDRLKDNYDMGETVTTLLDNSSMKVEIVKYEAYNISNGLDDEQTVMTHYSPTMEATKKFKGAGLPYYEYTFSFDAEVPYENEGWTNGEDLSKFDQDELEKKTLEFYGLYSKIHQENNIDLITSLNYDMQQRISIAFYKTKGSITELWEEFKKPVNYKNKDYQPFKDYEMKFYGNKRIVVLKYPVMNPIDKRLKGKSAFWFKYKEDGNIMAYWLTIYLYIPKGGTLDDLQTIK